MTVIECVISLFAYSISKAVKDKTNSEPVFQMAVFFYAMCSLIEVFIWIYLFILRFSHAG